MSLLEFYLVSVALSLMYVAIFYGAGKLSKQASITGMIVSIIPILNSIIAIFTLTIVAVGVLSYVNATLQNFKETR
jgi:hypothetical protein